MAHDASFFMPDYMQVSRRLDNYLISRLRLVHFVSTKTSIVCHRRLHITNLVLAFSTRKIITDKILAENSSVINYIINYNICN